MASSQVEIASSSPFDYVINNNRCCVSTTRDSNCFKQNFKNLVHSCISNEGTFSSGCCDGKNIQESSLEGGVSSLVRKWKDFETESRNLNSGFDESCSAVMKIESDWELDDKTDIIRKDSDSVVKVKESERLGVADIIKKLKFDNNNNVVVAAVNTMLPRVRTSAMDHVQKCVLSSPRFIRGRQAFSDLLLQMERDRKRELDALVERKAVSKFQQRGRIQALLRVRLIRGGAEVRGGRSDKCSASESNKSTHSAIMQLREKFNSVGQHGLAVSRNTTKEATESIRESGSLASTPNRQQKENNRRDFKGLQRELARSNSAKVGTGFSLYQQREEDPLKELVKERAEEQPRIVDSIGTSITLGDNTRDLSISKKENHHKPRSPDKELVDKKPKVGQQEENHHEEVPEQVSLTNVATSVKVGNRLSSHQQREGDQQNELVRERAESQPGTASGEKARVTCTSKEESHHKSRNSQKEAVDNIPKVGTFCVSNQPREENHYEELCKKLSSRKVATSIQVTNLSENQKEMACSSKKSEGSCILNHQHDMNLTSLPSCTSQAQCLDDILEKASWENTSFEAPKDRGTNKQCLVESGSGSVSDYSLTASGWDELQSNNYQKDDEDWISNISRPRKEWEGLRQERYQEMLDSCSEKHDIQQLLHRKSVSSFLTSGLREKIDRIMVSRSQRLPNATISHVEKEVSAQVAEDEEEDEVEQDAREVDDEVEEEWGYDDDSEDDNSPSRQRYDEPEVLLLKNTSSQTLQSWNTNPYQEVTDDSYHFPSPSSLQSQSSNVYSQPCSSSTGQTSTEMELIYEMRGHMEQLHHEIFEIRRSMKSCMNMQMKLQQSIKQDVAAAISQLGQKSRGNSDNNGSNNGKCCICCEKPVDSLLYRCGHMCTCFMCAHELISGTGKCPICQAPIMDVVRAYAHS